MRKKCFLTSNFALLLIITLFLQQKSFCEGNFNLEKIAQDVAKNNLSLIVTLNKSNTYVKEAIIADYYLLLNQEIILQNINSVKAPSFYSLKSHEVNMESPIYRDTLIENIVFHKALLHRYILIPQKAGEVKIGRFEAEFQLRLPLDKNSEYANQYKDNYFDMNYVAASDEAILQVIDLPAHKEKPVFVGDFDIDCALSKVTAQKNENIIFSVNITGNGYLGEHFVPQIEKTEGLKTNIYKTHDSFNIAFDNINSWKTYEVDLLSAINGEFVVEPIEILCFSPTNKKYYTLSTNGSPVFYLDNETQTDKENSANPAKSILIILIFICVLGLILLIIIFYKKNSNKCPVKDNFVQNANFNNKYLAAAFNNINNDTDIFLRELVTGIDNFIEDKFGIEKNKYSNENIANLLKEKGITENLIQNYKIMHQKIDEVRFSAKQTFVDKEKLYFFVEQFLQQFI